MSKRLSRIIGCKDRTSSLFPGSHIQRIGCQPEKTKKLLYTVANGSWSAEQGKENQKQSLAAYPPHTKSRDASIGATQVSVGLASIPSARRLGQPVLLRKILRFRVR